MRTNTPSSNHKTRIRRSPEDWRVIVNDWKKSGQSQQAYCQQQALCYRLFNQWKNRFIQKTKDKDDEANDKSIFIPVQVNDIPHASDHDAVNGITITLPNKIQLSLSQTHDTSYALTLIKQLVTLPC